MISAPFTLQVTFKIHRLWFRQFQLDAIQSFHFLFLSFNMLSFCFMYLLYSDFSLVFVCYFILAGK